MSLRDDWDFDPSLTHVGRDWEGHRTEDECPCPKQPCQLVSLATAHPDCTQHTGHQTMRQGHDPSACPGGDDA